MSGQLFHVQHISESVVSSFVPRIPSERILFEDDVIPRICLSSTIQGAIKGSQVLYRNYEKDFYHSIKGMYLRVYLFNKGQMDLSYLLKPEEIQDYVVDAMFTKEHWYLQKLLPLEYFYVFVELSEQELEQQMLVENIRFEIIKECSMPYVAS
ncbi:hypothetical protein ABD91_20525 [Lysinibacillus sphaericus]|uniref:hypothetical protein n=1 Tax=Lysinibacillus sphaericus TaxID=1421 RepID=UPI0018CE6ACE|nr:hypothetical protein [Lysinibacillus sphaericus]MBG9693129.1 hypothetical protein [Lysinibacillus sphaericus]